MGKINSLGVMLDCSRDAVYTVETLGNFFKLISAMGYSTVQLYTEDTFEVDGEPYFGYLRGRYSETELKEIDRLAAENGLELIPCIQTLAHLGGVTRWEDEYMCCTDAEGILLADEDKTYTLIEHIFASLAKCFTSRRVNIGMDEAHLIGLGRYLDKHGFVDRVDLLLRHLRRVLRIAEKYGFRPMMWSDMFFRLTGGGEYETSGKDIPPEIAAKIPENLDLVYWDYGNFDEAHYRAVIKAHRRMNRRIVFAGGSWTWGGFVPDNALAIKASEAAIRACIKEEIDEVFVTCWKDDGAECSLFGALPTLMCVAEFAKGNFDRVEIAKKFKNVTGVEWEDFAAIERMNLKNKIDTLANPCKYMLYADPFLGIFDTTVNGTEAETFAQIGKRLETVNNSKFGYIFDTYIALCDVLQIKYALGVKTRNAYTNRDMSTLLALTEEYSELERRVETFYFKFRTQWEKECKPHGFEKHDVRLGGLLFRIRHCRETIKEFCAGERSEIAQLDETILPFKQKIPAGSSIYFNDWLYSAMIKPKM